MSTGAVGNPGTAAVIVNYRTKELTCEAARSVMDEPGVQEIVLVDNASSDGSVELLRSTFDDLRVTVVESAENVGFGQGVNLGVSRSRSPLLLFLNSDAVVVPGSVERLSRTLLADESTGLVAPAVYDIRTGDLQKAAYGVFPTLGTIIRRVNHHPPETIWPDWVSGAAMLIRRCDFESVGGFDPDFVMYLEDVDLCRRLHAAGRKVRRDLTAGVEHRVAQSWDDKARPMADARASRVVYASKAGLSPVTRAALRGLQASHRLAAPFRSRRAPSIRG